MLYPIVKYPNLSAEELNHDLEKINQWANQLKMAFNPDPNKQANEVLFSSKKKKVDHPPTFYLLMLLLLVLLQKYGTFKSFP